MQRKRITSRISAAVIEDKRDFEPASTANFGKISLVEMERHHILHVLNEVNGNKSQAARILDISRSTLREKLKNYQSDE